MMVMVVNVLPPYPPTARYEDERPPHGLQHARIQPAQQKSGVKAPPKQARQAAEQQRAMEKMMTIPTMVMRKISKASKSAMVQRESLTGMGETRRKRRGRATKGGAGVLK
jgi:hypothetical protein